LSADAGIGGYDVAYGGQSNKENRQSISKKIWNFGGRIRVDFTDQANVEAGESDGSQTCETMKSEGCHFIRSFSNLSIYRLFGLPSCSLGAGILYRKMEIPSCAWSELPPNFNT
jgi:hypothetical protein